MSANYRLARSKAAASGERDRYWIRLECSIVSHYREDFDFCLSDQHAVERIGVILRELAQGLSMARRHRQFRKLACRDSLGDSAVEAQPAEHQLDNNLPCAGGTDEHLPGLRDRTAGRRGQLAVS
jgi:hypothetical protein